MANKSDEDMHNLHAQYIEFLRKDLAYSDAHQALSNDEKTTAINQIAKKMMARWKAYGTALADNRRGYVRLSIHDSSSSGPSNKLSITLVPQAKGVLGHTPWHSCIAVDLDGTYRTVHPSAVRDTHTLIYRNGQPSFYRAKSPLFDWTESGLNVTFNHLYPQGLIIRPITSAESNPSPPMTALPMRKIRELSHTFSPVVLRGFSGTRDKALFQASAYELGEVLTWPQYGIMAVVKDTCNDSKLANNVTSNEAMPMHFDGIFKYRNVPDPTPEEPERVKKVLSPPGYQYFTCIATAPKGSGYTLFASSRLFWRYLPTPWSVERLDKVTWGTLNTGFWKMTQEGLALVVRHPITKEPCLRWHEPWSKTKYSTCELIIENDDEALIEAVNSLLYDRRVCLRFSWEEGDLLVNDNVSMLHTRTAYEGGSDREMWRIHFD
ncbi:Clavaminate synthase-like protein [Lophiostoma macrostomum CBS 122681]|uniref:Clavaminate synthase-like protein n=1 Tax=Lophiostoma macrostomum CBS 122681 TaxID=1314788 RepID=A0A6A6THF1_9PLEO|nr:Clavaminate synthase-like protein [Lophiostoma macrostomum CBS 122681]